MREIPLKFRVRLGFRKPVVQQRRTKGIDRLRNERVIHSSSSARSTPSELCQELAAKPPLQTYMLL
eukprot:1358778-Amorphochlora_amoeboformis.AAC.2